MVYKVLVVDDSVFMRKLISDLINSDPAFNVIDTARNGNDAIKKTRLFKPDIITLDIEMPVMNGLEALYHIINEDPRPVIMLSAYSQKEAESTFKAMELGAVDFVPKPSGEISLDLNTIKEQLLQKLRSAMKARISAKLINQTPIITRNYLPSQDLTPSDNFVRQLIVIAASTGGPRALVNVITNLPISIHCPILIVQHMQEGFTTSFAERLNSLSVLPVSEAKDEEIIQNGHIYLAPGNYHMTVRQDLNTRIPMFRVHLDQRPHRLGVRPNANYLFESAVDIFQKNILGIVLTGMGKDGAEGAKLIHQAGGKVITEDESTAVVFGMPKMAEPYADVSCPLPQIPEKMIEYYQLLRSLPKTNEV